VEANGYWPVSTNLTLPAYDTAEWKINLQSKQSELTVSTEPKTTFHIRVRGPNGLDWVSSDVEDRDGTFKVPNSQQLSVELLSKGFWIMRTNFTLLPSKNTTWNVKLVPAYTELTVGTIPPSAVSIIWQWCE